jgi:hypothetical protein
MLSAICIPLRQTMASWIAIAPEPQNGSITVPSDLHREAISFAKTSGGPE